MTTRLDVKAWMGGRKIVDIVESMEGKFRMHPLGFADGVAEGHADGRLRVHLWLRTWSFAQSPLWPIHDHSYALKSIVALGSLRTRTCLIGAGEPYLVHEVEYLDNVSCLRNSGSRVLARLGATQEVAAGMEYEVAAGAFHVAECSTSLGASVAYCSKSTQPSSRVLVPENEAVDSVNFCREPLPDSLFRAWLDSYADEEKPAV